MIWMWPFAPPPPPPPPSVFAPPPYWRIAASATWAGGCLIAFAALWWGTHGADRYYRTYFSGYLACHILAALAQIGSFSSAACSVELTRTDQEGGVLGCTLLDFAIRLFVLAAGHTYFLIGARLLIAPPLSHELIAVMRRRAGIATAVCLVGSAAVLGSLMFATARRNRVDEATAFGISMYALAVGVAFCGVLSALRRHPTVWQIRLFFGASVMGVVDALLPLLAPPGAPWQPNFVSRLLDVLFFLPGAVVSLRWLDMCQAWEATRSR
jgi:hypothetical protein